MTSRGQRPPAFWLMVVSTASLAANLVVPLLGVIVNWLLVVVARGGDVPGEGNRAYLDVRNWYGLFPVPLPWWVFPLLAAPVLAVAIITRAPAWRWDPPLSYRSRVQRTTPRFLVGGALMVVGVQAGLIQWFDPSFTVVSPYWLGPLIALAAAAVSLGAAHQDARAASREAQGGPAARALGIVSAVVFALFWILGPLGIVVQQLLITMSSGIPVDPAARKMAELWDGALLLIVPWQLFLALGVATLALSVVLGTPARQFSPATPLAFLARTTPGIRGAHAAAIAIVSLWVISFDTDAVLADHDLAVMLSWGAAALVTHLFWRVGHNREMKEIARTGRRSSAVRKASGA